MPLWQRWNLFLNRPLRILSKPFRVLLWLLVPGLPAQWAFAFRYQYQSNPVRHLWLIVLRFITLVARPSIERYRELLAGSAQPNAPPPNRATRRAMKKARRLGRVRPNYWRSMKREKIDAVTERTWFGAVALGIVSLLVSLPLLVGLAASRSADSYNRALFQPASVPSSVLGADSLDPQATATIATYTGSFTKIDTVANQDIQIAVDLTAASAGTWAIIFWTSGVPGNPASGTWVSHIQPMIGYTTGASNSYVVTADSVDAQTTSVTGRRMAAKCISLNYSNTTLKADADFVGFNSSGVGGAGTCNMRLSWTTNAGSSPQSNVIGYTIFNGLTNAKVVTWTTPTTNTTKAVTGVGFSPDLVFHIGNSSSTTSEANAGSLFDFGAMNKHGQQWANGIGSVDAVNPANSSRWQQTDACYVDVTGGESTRFQAHFQSMDSDGFTTYFSGTTGTAFQVASLCLKGLSSKLGSFVTTSGASMVVDTRSGFQPRGALFSNFRDSPTSAPSAHAIWNFGSTDFSNHRSASSFDKDAVSPTVAKSVWHNDASLVVAYDSAVQYKATVSTNSSGVLTATASTATSGMEVLYVVVGDAGTNTFPFSAQPSTNHDDATAFSNQKKGCTLSTGRQVIMVKNSGNLGSVYYSDDGQSWTNATAGVPIDGWAHGSFDVYVDSGGTERLVALWKQTGTGGGRVDGEVYVLVGTFNAGRTAITWGSTVTVVPTDVNIAGYNYPDVCCHAEGTGGVAHIVVSFASATGPNNYVGYERVAINSSGVLGAESVDGLTDFSGTAGNDLGALGGSYSVNVHTWPSITVNLSDKRIHVAWSAGATGAGKGVRYRTASYSAGTWTWATEVEVDNGVYLQDTSHWVVCRWDGTRIVAGVFGWTGSLRPLKTYESTNFTSFTTRTHVSDVSATSMVRIEYGSMAVDSNTGDIYMFGYAFLASSDNQLYYYKWTRSGGSLGSPVVVEGGISTNGYANAWYSGSTIRWLYTLGNNSPYSVKYDQLVLNLAPLAPTLTSPTAGAVIDGAAGFTSTWTHNDPNGDAQLAYAYKRKLSGGSDEWWNAGTSLWQGTEVYNTVSTQSVAFPASKWTNGQSYSYAVSTKDPAGLAGPYSAYTAFTTSTPPTFTLTGPASTVTDSNSPLIEWTLSDPESDSQQTYQYVIEHGAYSTTPGSGTQDYDSTETISSAARSIRAPVALTNGSTYRVFFRGKAGGQYDSWRYQTFTISLSAPAAPTLTTSFEASNGRVVLTIQGRDNLLTTNQASVETDTTGFVAGSSTTIARSTAQAKDGGASLSMTRTGTTGTGSATTLTGTSGVAVVAGSTYTAVANFRAAATPRSCNVGINWYTAAGASISTSTSSNITSSTSVWTQAAVTDVAPPTAAFAAVVLSSLSMAASEVVYVDCIGVSPGSSTTWTRGGLVGSTSFYVERSTDGGTTWATVIGTSTGVAPNAAQVATAHDYAYTPAKQMSYRVRAKVTV